MRTKQGTMQKRRNTEGGKVENGRTKRRMEVSQIMGKENEWKNCNAEKEKTEENELRETE